MEEKCSSSVGYEGKRKTIRLGRKRWQYIKLLKTKPYQSPVVLVGVLVVAYLIEAITGWQGFPRIVYPYSYLAWGFLLLWNASLYFVLRRKFPSFVAEWTRLQTAFWCLAVFFFHVLMMSWKPQITRTWSFALIVFVLLMHLGFVILKRWEAVSVHPIQKYSKKNIAFFLLHFGLWLLISLLALGSDDLVRIRMVMYEGMTTYSGLRSSNSSGSVDQMVDMPFAIRLRKFELDEYPPQFMFWDDVNKKSLVPAGQVLMDIHQKEGHLGEWKIKVLNHFNMALPFEKEFVPIEDWGATAAAFVEVFHFKSKSKIRGWLSPGSFRIPPLHLVLPTISPSENKMELALSLPRPKNFKFHIDFYANDEPAKSMILEMNKSFSWRSWRIYPLSYDEAMGKWSQQSTLEAVYDPWLIPLYGSGLLVALGLLFFL